MLDPTDAEALLAAIADHAVVTLDELLALPPENLRDPAVRLAFIKRLRAERAEAAAALANKKR